MENKDTIIIKVIAENFVLRHSNITDLNKMLDLYKCVAGSENGLATTKEEMDEEYISEFLGKSLKTGLSLVIEDTRSKEIVAEIHAYKLPQKVLSHLLSELTIVVHPDYQGKGFGKEIFSTFLSIVEKARPEIMRVELLARESSKKAISFYESLGFKIEGRFEHRIAAFTGGYEADIFMVWFNPGFREMLQS